MPVPGGRPFPSKKQNRVKMELAWDTSSLCLLEKDGEPCETCCLLPSFPCDATPTHECNGDVCRFFATDDYPDQVYVVFEGLRRCSDDSLVDTWGMCVDWYGCITPNGSGPGFRYQNDSPGIDWFFADDYHGGKYFHFYEPPAYPMRFKYERDGIYTCHRSWPIVLDNDLTKDNCGALALYYGGTATIYRPGQPLYISSCTALAVSQGCPGTEKKGRCTFNIKDEDNNNVSGATIYFDYSGPISGSGSAVTDANGNATGETPCTNNTGTLTFTVTAITKTGYFNFIPWDVCDSAQTVL